MKKYIISILKYIVVIIVALFIFTAIQLSLPQETIVVTINQAIVIFVIGVILLAVALKATFKL